MTHKTFYQAPSNNPNKYNDLKDVFEKIIGDSSTKKDNHHDILKAFWLDTKLGPMLAISTEEKLVLLEFIDRCELEHEIERLRVQMKSIIIPGKSNPIISIESELNLYFDGRLRHFKTPIHLLGTPFQRRVWEELIQIPYGTTKSYLEQSRSIGNEKSYRAVANANGANQLAIIIPCHRIIRDNGDLGGYRGGLLRKQWLLDFEKGNAMQEIKKIREQLKTRITVPEESRTRFFKVGPGDYAEHDQFMGVTIPNLRKIAKNFLHLPLDDLQILISSVFNEERLLGVFILSAQYKKASIEEQELFYQFYMHNLKYINNWNIVDASAHLILGEYLLTREREVLKTLVYSDVMWKRRVAIISTWQFIKNNDLCWTFDLAQTLFNDPHDLMHKATGWMLREAGKCNQETLITFLTEHYKKMPRTMVRYAIEKLPKESWSLYR